MKITIVTLDIGDAYSKYVSLSRKAKEIYCQRYNYNLYVGNELYDTTRPPAWTKILALQKILKTDSDYVVWMDADLLIMNHDIGITSFISMMEGKDFMFAKDIFGPLNSGIIFIKNTRWAYDILSYIYTLFDKYNTNMWDQTGFTSAYENNVDGFKDRTIIVENLRFFNSTTDEFRWGDFIIHLLGTRMFREGLIEQLLHFHYPFKIETETDTEYNNRMVKLKTKYIDNTPTGIRNYFGYD